MGTNVISTDNQKTDTVNDEEIDNNNGRDVKGNRVM